MNIMHDEKYIMHGSQISKELGYGLAVKIAIKQKQKILIYNYTIYRWHTVSAV